MNIKNIYEYIFYPIPLHGPIRELYLLGINIQVAAIAVFGYNKFWQQLPNK